MSEPTRLKAIAAGVFIGTPAGFAGVIAIGGVIVGAAFEGANNSVLFSIGAAAYILSSLTGLIFKSSRSFPGLYVGSTLLASIGTTAFSARDLFYHG